MIACGALGAHLREITARRQWPVELHTLPAPLHNHPQQIAPWAERLAAEAIARGQRVAVAYADCGTYGALDDVCARLGLRRLPGLHCYDVFVMTLTVGSERENHVVEFEEGRRIAWTPAEPGKVPPGHLWRWELEPVDASRTRVTHTYDWTRLTDEGRLPRARATTADRLQASLDRLAALAEAP